MSTPSSTEEFEAHRTLLFTVAYEMLGSAADAEDVVQESWLQWADVDHTQVRDPRAFLIRIVTQQTLNRMRTLSRRREKYVGEWLPEPLLTAPDVADDVEARRPRIRVSRAEQEEVVERFLAAIRTGDVDGLLSVLAPDVVAVGDGGGLAPAARRPIEGAYRVAKSLLLVARTEGVSMHPMWVNGALAITIEHDGKVHSGDTAGHVTCHTSTVAGVLLSRQGRLTIAPREACTTPASRSERARYAVCRRCPVCGSPIGDERGLCG